MERIFVKDDGDLSFDGGPKTASLTVWRGEIVTTRIYISMVFDPVEGQFNFDYQLLAEGEEPHA